jgi:hypothetical protein
MLTSISLCIIVFDENLRFLQILVKIGERSVLSIGPVSVPCLSYKSDITVTFTEIRFFLSYSRVPLEKGTLYRLPLTMSNDD